MTRYPLYRRLSGPQGWSGWVRKISPPQRFDPRTAQPVASRVKRLKIFGFCIFRQHYSTTVRESTCRSQSTCLYCMYVRATSPHRPIGSNIVTACTCVSNSKFVKLMYTCAASLHVVCDKVRVNTCLNNSKFVRFSWQTRERKYLHSSVKMTNYAVRRTKL